MLNLDQFNPKVAELHELATKYQAIEIKWIEDKDGYRIAKEAKKELQTTRITITKQGKEMREDALKFQRDVLAKEKELVGIIDPIETHVENQIARYDELVEIEKRKEKLPARKEIMQVEIPTVEMAEEDILKMTDDDFERFILTTKSQILEAKQKEIEAREAQIRQKEQEEEQKRQQELRKAEIEAAQKEAAEKAAKETEERIKREQEEKQRQEKLAEEQKAQKEKEEQEKLEKRKKYIEYRASLGWTEETKHLFQESNNGKTVTIWKQVGEFTL